jgi:hypothetical protein
MEFNFDLNNGGASLIMCNHFIAFIPYNTHYRLHYGVKLHVEPWNYLGYYTLPELQKQYPETANIKQCWDLVDFEEPHEILLKSYDRSIETRVKEVVVAQYIEENVQTGD